ncbi:PTS sugar transporter subunit IIC [Catenibacterium mitsuokai]|uniref:PTS sugar transporter subunit IIC n=8 Tax=Catenibacterium mitsuokai TaxID=100886 RepID=UPI000196C030|nr:PTS transporter subunit EIIC [Catenibacterium mitsuokai]EEF92448.1 PTS system, lactose/cellobiose family IIC component [Catenibacterium mitsuokai DSM 15897]UWO53584.1 PTS transporter subunit EIIC [Catenibacterium mitsuokai]
MDAFADKLGRVGAWCGQNKYLNAIKNGFQNFMPATISGAVGVLWTNVLVNSSTGLGAIWKPIMALEVLNPIFAAMQYATISCITIGVTMLVASEIAEANGETGAYPAVLGFILWMMVTPTSFAAKDLGASYIDAKGISHGFSLGQFINVTGEAAKHKITADSFSYSGIMSSYTGATGLFTGLIVAIVGMELYNMFRKNDALKIKMPEQVPPGVARAFEVLIPTCLTAIVVGAVGLVCQLATGAELNALIYNVIQKPLQNIIGNNLVAVCIMYVIIMLFWCVGIHGNNMVAAVKEPIFRPLLYANTAAYTAHHEIPYVMNLTMIQMFAEFGGSGVTIGLVIAILIFSKREDNRTIAGISIVPGLFNINETMTFGIPLVLNPILDIPFILAPVVTVIIGYILVSSGFCPKIVLEVPWTMPPVLFGFVATGGKPMGAVAQLIVLAVSVLVYIPFLIAYEKFQAKQAAE